MKKAILVFAALLLPLALANMILLWLMYLRPPWIVYESVAMISVPKSHKIAGQQWLPDSASGISQWSEPLEYRVFISDSRGPETIMVRVQNESPSQARRMANYLTQSLASSLKAGSEVEIKETPASNPNSFTRPSFLFCSLIITHVLLMISGILLIYSHFTPSRS